MLTTSQVKQTKKKKLKILGIAGPKAYLKSLVLGLFSNNKNKKVVRTKIYLTRVVYTAARQALDKSRKFVKTTIYKYRVVYTAQMKARQALDKIKDIQAKKTSTKNKGSSFKKKYNILVQRLEYKGQIH